MGAFTVHRARRRLDKMTLKGYVILEVARGIVVSRKTFEHAIPVGSAESRPEGDAVVVWRPSF